LLERKIKRIAQQEKGTKIPNIRFLKKRRDLLREQRGICKRVITLSSATNWRMTEGGLGEGLTIKEKQGKIRTIVENHVNFEMRLEEIENEILEVDGLIELLRKRN